MSLSSFNPMQRSSSGGWLLILILSLLCSLITGLVLVWLSIERTDKAYTLRQMYLQLEERRVLKTKLEVERDKLLAPYILSKKALELQMQEARAGQIRRLTDPGTGEQ